MPLSYIARVQMGIRGLTWWHPDVGVRPATLPPVPSPGDEAMCVLSLFPAVQGCLKEVEAAGGFACALAIGVRRE